jgi:superfamily II DNA or RNA helicase
LGQATDELEKEVAKLEWQFKFFSSKRKTLLHTLESSRKVAQAVSLKIRADHPASKILVFSALTSQIDKICKYTYHSKNKKNNPNIKMFNDGEFHILGAVDAINRGLNMVGVDYLIKESYIGSETKFQQQHGRGTRLDISSVMKFIILLPYYEDWVTYKEKDTYGRVINVRKLERVPTQACHWAVRMADSFDMSNSRTIVMNDDYTLPAGASL